MRLPARLLERLRHHRTRQQQEYLAHGKPWSTSELVFTSVVCTPISPRNMVRHFKAMLRKADLPEHIRIHDLRHSCATFLIVQGEHPKVIQHVLRHSDFRFTMSIYGHILEENEMQAIDALGEMLGT